MSDLPIVALVHYPWISEIGFFEPSGVEPDTWHVRCPSFPVRVEYLAETDVTCLMCLAIGPCKTKPVKRLKDLGAKRR